MTSSPVQAALIVVRTSVGERLAEERHEFVGAADHPAVRAHRVCLDVVGERLAVAAQSLVSVVRQWRALSCCLTA